MSYSKSPWLKFEPTAWRNDIGLQSCSLAAQGLWINLMCFMHESPDYGNLILSGGVNPEVNLHKLIGLPQNEITLLLDELETNGVFSRRDNDSIIFSRKMVRDYARSQQSRLNGKKGGNPNLIKAGVNLPDKSGVKLRTKNKELRKENNKSCDLLQKKIKIPEALNTPEFLEAWKSWIQHLGELKKKITESALKKQLAHCEEIGIARAIAMIDFSIERSYQGLFEKSNNQFSNTKNNIINQVAPAEAFNDPKTAW